MYQIKYVKVNNIFDDKQSLINSPEFAEGGVTAS